MEAPLDKGLMTFADVFWRWVRFGKRTHREGVLEGYLLAIVCVLAGNKGWSAFAKATARLAPVRSSDDSMLTMEGRLC